MSDYFTRYVEKFVEMLWLYPIIVICVVGVLTRGKK